jgi:hypothetical protein
VRFEDADGRPWMVVAGDPAAQLANRLKRIGVEYVVLPAQVFRSGKVDFLERFGYDEKATGAASSSSALPPPPPLSSTDGAALFVRSVRLNDCLTWLNEEAPFAI